MKDKEPNTFLTPVKKTRKFYAVSRDKWFLGSNATKTEFDESETGFLAISEVTGDLDKMDNCLEQGRIYLQTMFRQEDPNTHVIKLKPFWIMPWGPAMLSHQFEWNVNGSDDGNLASSISDQLDSVLELTVAILGRKKETPGRESIMKLNLFQPTNMEMIS